MKQSVVSYMCLIFIYVFRLERPEQTQHSISDKTNFLQNDIDKKHSCCLAQFKVVTFVWYKDHIDSVLAWTSIPS